MYESSVWFPCHGKRREWANCKQDQILVSKERGRHSEIQLSLACGKHQGKHIRIFVCNVKYTYIHNLISDTDVL